MTQTKHPKKYHVFFAGGLTAGPMMPLVALAKEWHSAEPEMRPVFFDVYKSVAKSAVLEEGFKLHTISAAKFRRYLSWKTLVAPMWFVLSLLQSLFYLLKYRPKLVVGAGGFVQVPLMMMATLLRIPYAIHQQDVLVTLSNVVCAPLAKRITTVFESSLKSFPEGSGFGKDLGLHSKVTCVGNPTRYKNLPSREEAIKFFGLDNKWPTLLVMGGGSGAEGLNELITKNLPELTKTVQILHSTGKGKGEAVKHERYHAFEFIDRMDLAYSASDIVISRAGIGALSELSQFSKPAIIMPMPGTHQELNAKMLTKYRAATVFDQNTVTIEELATEIKKIMHDHQHKTTLEKNIAKIMPHNATEGLMQICKQVLNS